MSIIEDLKILRQRTEQARNIHAKKVAERALAEREFTKLQHEMQNKGYATREALEAHVLELESELIKQIQIHKESLDDFFTKVGQDVL